MGKYDAIELLWSSSQNRYIYPGEYIELDNEMAKTLMRKKVIKPARFVPDRVGKSRKARTPKVGNLDKE